METEKCPSFYLYLYLFIWEVVSDLLGVDIYIFPQAVGMLKTAKFEAKIYFLIV